MQTIDQLRQRLKTVTDLKSVVSTMKSLAAARIRQFESVANATQAYNDNVELGLQILLQQPDCPEQLLFGSPSHRSASANLSGVILLGSDQGFCGRFNANVLEFLQSKVLFVQESNRPESGQSKGHSALDSRPRLIGMGSKLASLFESHKLSVDEVISVPASVPGINTVVHQLLGAINQWRDTYGIESIQLIFNQRRHASPPQTVLHQLLPFESDFLGEVAARPWQSRSLPTIATTWAAAFSNVIQQRLFIQVYRCVAESLASENSSRIQAMQNAEANIDNRLAEIESAFKQARQGAITDEIREIVCAAGAQDL